MRALCDWFRRWVLQDRRAQGRFEAARFVKRYGWHQAWQAYAENSVGDEFDAGFRARLKELAPPGTFNKEGKHDENKER